MADTVWTATSSALASTTADTTDKKEGTASADILIDATGTTGVIAYKDLDATVDISKLDLIQLWVKATISLAKGDYEIVVDDTAACISPLENIDLPVLVTSTWTLVTLAITDNSDMTAVKCVRLNVAVDKGASTVNLDQIESQGQATTLRIMLANTLEGEAIDVSEPGDSDANGVSDSDSEHTMILTYTDKNQVVKDLYWTNTFIGQNDSDDLLEAGEKVELNVRLSGLSASYPVSGDTKFDIELRPESGGTVVVERTMPDIIDTVMNLN